MDSYKYSCIYTRVYLKYINSYTIKEILSYIQLHEYILRYTYNYLNLYNFNFDNFISI